MGILEMYANTPLPQEIRVKVKMSGSDIHKYLNMLMLFYYFSKTIIRLEYVFLLACVRLNDLYNMRHIAHRYSC